VQPQDAAIKRIEVQAEDGHPASVQIILEFDNVPSPGAAMAVAKPEIARLLSRISFRYNLPVHDPGLPTHQFESTTADGKTCYAGDVGRAVSCSITGKQPRVLAATHQHALKSFLDGPPSPKDSKYDEVRRLLDGEDVVERFLFLYSILLREKGPSQANVDGFIKKQEPTVALRRSANPKTPKLKETVYTKLRNEIGHVCPGRTLDDTRREMEQFLPKLLELTKKAMA
jgi:hypothetical protein